MSEYFIVLSTAPTRHATLAEAQIEQEMLRRYKPEHTFTIHRCKTWLVGARHFTKMVELLRDIVADGLTAANLERARIVLFTIGNRNPGIAVTAGPPEFEPRGI